MELPGALLHRITYYKAQEDVVATVVVLPVGIRLE